MLPYLDKQAVQSVEFPAMGFKVGDSVELVIDDVAFGGDGVGRVDQQVVFVPFTVTGERVRARIKAIKKQHAVAELEEVLVPSMHRVRPLCPHLGAEARPLPCGGCQYQHIEYSHQLELKTAQVRETLRRIGSLDDVSIQSAIGSPRPYGYRNKITLRRSGSKLGYLATDNRTLLDIRECPIANEAVNGALAQLRDKFRRDKPSSGKQVDTDIVIRRTSTGQICWFAESRGGKPSVGLPVAPTWIEEQVLGRTLKLPPASFFQVNEAILPQFVRLISEWFASSEVNMLVDAYCGVGLFSLMLADKARNCYGIESDSIAVSAARYNAERLGLMNCHFAEGKVEEVLASTLSKLDANDCCVILDPPRSGCEPSVIETLLRAHPRQIIYISCNPPALARDLKKLVGSDPEQGAYQLKRVVPLDMFPQTAHCEVVAELRSA